MVMTADEADGADRDPRPDRPAARRRASRAASRRRSARRRGCSAPASSGAILNVNALVWQDWATADRRDVAPGPGAVGRRLPVRHRRPHAQHRRRPRRRGRRPGRRLARGRRPAGRHPRPSSWPGSHPGRSITMNGCGRAIPSLRLGHPGVTASAGRCGPGSGASGSRCSEPARERLAQGPLRAPTIPVWEQFLERPGGPRSQPEPARGRPADGPAVGRDPRVVGRGGAVVRSATGARGRRGMTIRVTVWNEYRQERSDPPVAPIYPDGIHAAIAAGLRDGRLRRPDRDARRAGARPDRRGPRRDRRADLVGPRRPRRGRRRGRRPGPARGSSTGWAWSSSTRATTRRSSGA